jgi:ABC-type nickel/cobalt efflux system permease component RcnA
MFLAVVGILVVIAIMSIWSLGRAPRHPAATKVEDVDASIATEFLVEDSQPHHHKHGHHAEQSSPTHGSSGHSHDAGHGPAHHDAGSGSFHDSSSHSGFDGGFHGGHH